MSSVQIIGILAVIIGLFLRYTVGKRRFYRRGPGGMQEFSSYAKAVTFTYLERLMNIIGTLLIIGGIVLFLAEVYNKKMAAKHREKSRTIETR